MGHLWKKFFRLFAVRYAGIYHDDRLYGDEVFYHGGGDCLCGDKRQIDGEKLALSKKKRCLNLFYR